MDRNPLLSLQLFCKSKIIPKQRERTSRPERSCALQQRAVPAPHVVCSWTRQPWVPVSELRFHSIHSALGVGRTAPLGVTNSLPGLELKPSDPGDQGAFLGCSHADPQGGPMPTESWGRTHHVLHLRNAREALPDLHTAPRSQAWAPSRPPLPASLSCQLLKASIRLPASLELGGLGHPLQSPHSARAAESQLSIPLLPSPASAPASCPSSPAGSSSQNSCALTLQCPSPAGSSAGKRLETCPPLAEQVAASRRLPASPGPSAHPAQRLPPSADHFRARLRPPGVSVSGSCVS